MSITFSIRDPSCMWIIIIIAAKSPNRTNSLDYLLKWVLASVHPQQSMESRIQNVAKPSRNQEESNAGNFQQYSFDRTVVPEQAPQPMKTQTNTAGDRIIVQANVSVAHELREYDLAVEKLQQLGQAVFSDPNFPHERSSLSKDSRFKANRDIAWKRPQQYMTSGEVQLFENGIDPMDIKQGELGDCYFLSSLSALAEIPEIVKKIFITKSYQQNGLYGVYLCHNGILKQVALDDYIPCHLQNGPIFSKNRGNELWVLLLEKAYAKLFGSYHKIESGLSSCALKDLTGAPSEYFIRRGETLKDADLCWQFLEKHVPKDYILTASSEVNEGGVEFQKDNGIVSQHCYAILDIQNVKGSDGIQDRIIQIRNPWGRKEWTGDWSDASAKWTPELQQKLKVQQKDDGIFWISVKDFIQEFSQVCVSKLIPNYLYSSAELSQRSGETRSLRIMFMRVYKQMHGFISVVQKDKRHFDRHQYSLARIIIGLIDPLTNQVKTYQGAAMDNERDVVVESNFQAGDYAVYIEVDWNQNYDRYIVLSAYSSEAVQFTEVAASDMTKEQILDGLLRVHEKFTDEEKVKDYGNSIKRISGLVAGYIYFWYQNGSSKVALKEELELKDRKFLDVCSPYSNSDKVLVEVAPKSQVFFKFRVAKEGGGSYGYTLSTTNQILESKSDDEIIHLALQKPEKVNQREIRGRIVEVYQKIVTFPTGMGILYQNNTNQTYKESLQLQTQNLRGVNFDVLSRISIVVPPRQMQLLTLKTIDTKQPCSYQMEMTFELE